MPYFDLAQLAQDPDFYLRVAACAQAELELGNEQPTYWASVHQWSIAAAPGFADAYAYAVANGVEHPGRDPSVITDEQLLAAVAAEAGA